MNRYIDIHTHHPTHRHIEPMAVGVHPWRAESEVFECGMFDNAIAIGEIGLDFACNVDRAAQERVFRAQLAEAERRNLPIVLHCVRAFEPMMKILAEYTIKSVIFHGFIGSPQQAERAINRGYYLSFGPSSFRSPKTVESLKCTPLNRLFAESDDSHEDIENIYERIAQAKDISIEKLQKEIGNNYKNIFTHINE